MAVCVAAAVELMVGVRVAMGIGTGIRSLAAGWAQGLLGEDGCLSGWEGRGESSYADNSGEAEVGLGGRCQ